MILFFFIRRSRKNILTYFLIVAGIIGFVFSVNLIYQKALQPHQQKRIDVLLGKISDVKDAGYNVNQSKIAIGSGGFIGKGFLHGTQTKYKFVPEQNTDFIFCTIGEEWGFVGSSIVVILFFLVYYAHPFCSRAAAIFVRPDIRLWAGIVDLFPCFDQHWNDHWAGPCCGDTPAVYQLRRLVYVVVYGITVCFYQTGCKPPAGIVIKYEMYFPANCRMLFFSISLLGKNQDAVKGTQPEI